MLRRRLQQPIAGAPPFAKRGLVNRPGANLCFANATLQALLRCDPFRCFLQHLSPRQAPSAPLPQQLLDSMLELYRHWMALPSGQLDAAPILRPLLAKFLQSNAGVGGQQQDAQEFLDFVVSGLDADLASLLPAARPAPQAPQEEAEEDGWAQVGRRNKAAIVLSSDTEIPSVVRRIFGGQMQSTVRVPGSGSTATMTLQRFTTLSLDIEVSVCLLSLFPAQLARLLQTSNNKKKKTHKTT
eukprot:TRINITY_DN5419_c0_g1_i2.p1 TRINITY_DN5419_c0_g1~~TRINITY_DN5419_c0_g1_i2.p1  ORF type:complete len:265 (+),score=63.19 TRINITY_DN5419_c0_g1_i2:75-797(+)